MPVFEDFSHNILILKEKNIFTIFVYIYALDHIFERKYPNYIVNIGNPGILNKLAWKFVPQTTSCPIALSENFPLTF